MVIQYHVKRHNCPDTFHMTLHRLGCCSQCHVKRVCVAIRSIDMMIKIEYHHSLYIYIYVYAERQMMMILCIYICIYIPWNEVHEQLVST